MNLPPHIDINAADLRPFPSTPEEMYEQLKLEQAAGVKDGDEGEPPWD